MKTSQIPTLLATGLALVALSGCSYVKRDDYNAALADLRATDAGLRTDVNNLQAGLSSLKQEMQAKFQGYDATITQMQGRVQVDTPARFAFGDATLREEDKPLLNDFASVIREHHPDVVVTAEGFADPAGSASYNKRLGQQRAEAVRDYLVASGGLDPAKVRAVSYGESSDRQLASGASGEQGAANRRVALVVEPSA